MDGLSVLHVFNVDHIVSGEVKCEARSPDNPKIFSVVYTSLSVLPLPLSERNKLIDDIVEEVCSDNDNESTVNDLTTYITKRPEDQTCLVGDSIQLEVEYVGAPEPSVRWMRAVSGSFICAKTD